ncbi:MAG TPA: phosphatidylinositol mannoside acyltransferase [Acidimicrobiales bacterium]|nr:phosphatidylinositol mannoside acyltransferase [Acidimicrobiales bacterium]
MNRTLTAFKVGSAVARAMPDVVADGLARVAGFGAAQVSPERRAQVERNLRRIHGSGLRGLELRRAVDATFESYARYWAESFRLPGTSPAVLDAGMSYRGLGHLDDGLARGKGVILALPHLGGWEWAGFWVAAVRHDPITVVVEALDPPELFEWFVGLRRSFGMNIVALGPDAAAQVARALKANHIVCLLCDRDIGGSGIEVDFFGERTTLPAGPATLALRSGAPLLPTAAYFQGRGHLGVCRSPVPTERTGRLRDDVARVTQLLAHELEALIRVAPEQWHLMQPNWPSDRSELP